MSWPLRFIESPYVSTPYYVLREGAEHPKVGDIWYAPELLVMDKLPATFHLSPKYERDWRRRRPPLVVSMPDGTNFCVDSRFWRSGQPYGDGWTVTGDAPLITVTPSINIGGGYHGYITNGVIGDDVEGRKF